MKGRTDVDDVMAIKPNFLTSMGYHVFLSMVLGARGAPLKQLLRKKKDSDLPAVQAYFQVNRTNMTRNVRCFHRWEDNREEERNQPNR